MTSNRHCSPAETAIPTISTIHKDIWKPMLLPSFLQSIQVLSDIPRIEPHRKSLKTPPEAL